MAAYYVDTSALAKRYVNETGSVWLRALADPVLRPLLAVSQLMVVEMASAFNRRLREGVLSPVDFVRLRNAFRGDCLTEYHLVPVNTSMFDLAGDLIERRPLRTLDAIHLATALSVHRFLLGSGLPGLTFVSADEHLLRAALDEGMATENPNDHP